MSLSESKISVMQSGDKKAATGLVLSLAAGGIYMAGPFAFPHIPSEIWLAFFELMVIISMTSGVYFVLIHTINEFRAMPISLMVIGGILFFAGAIWLGIVNERTGVHKEDDLRPVQGAVPNVVLLSLPDRLQLNNNGSFEILLWGDKLEGYPASLEKEARQIPPGYHYYFLTDMLRQVMLHEIGEYGQKLKDFETYLTERGGQRWVARFRLLVVMTDSSMVIHTQQLGVTEGIGHRHNADGTTQSLGGLTLK